MDPLTILAVLILGVLVVTACVVAAIFLKVLLDAFSDFLLWIADNFMKWRHF